MSVKRVSKLGLLFFSMSLILSVLSGCATKGEAHGDSLGLLVQTDKGLVQGAEDEKETWSWKGIPFAKPPVGELRWKAPREPEAWTGVLETTEFSPVAPQFDGNFPGEQSVIGSEDCLYLNVWRPRTQERDLPVYFWIHGGANSVGSASEYEGQNIAGKSHMVVVTINYRLGPLGWFSHPALREGENSLDGSGNYGTMDMIKALQWVQTNIEAFGGNPDNVMIAGESAGGFNVCSLLVSPRTEGLFHKAMSQSGGFNMVPVSQADESSERVLNEMLAADGRTDIGESEIAAYLRSKSVDELLNMYHPGGFGMLADQLMPLMDGTVLPSNGAEALNDPATYRQVPLIMGANKEEMKLFNYFTFDPAAAQEYQANMVAMSGFMIKNAVDNPLTAMAAHENQPALYAYQLNYGAYNKDGYNAWPDENSAIQFGACHALDLPLVWAQYPYLDIYRGIFRPENEKGYTALSDAMMAYIAQFAYTGNPGTVNGVTWEAWNGDGGAAERILFDADSTEALIAMGGK